MKGAVSFRFERARHRRAADPLDRCTPAMRDALALAARSALVLSPDGAATALARPSDPPIDGKTVAALLAVNLFERTADGDGVALTAPGRALAALVLMRRAALKSYLDRQKGRP